MALPTLYAWKWSGNCYKARLLASLLDIELDLANVDYPKEEHHSPEFLAINPRGQIPVLVHGDETLCDSAAILVYLAGSYPDPGMAKTPSSFWSDRISEQAAIVDWLAFAGTWIQSGVASARAITKFGRASATSESILEAARARGHKSLEILEARLRENDWLALGRPTVADVSVYVYVSLAHEGNIMLDSYSAVQSWISRVRGLPGFIPIDA
ncbi:putative glutathione S-transferase [Thozetella sp. PMI_491]|nr:putative glutathione S-transferase [Thozetella sp. PMI_491]